MGLNFKKLFKLQILPTRYYRYTYYKHTYSLVVSYLLTKLCTA